MATLNMTAQEIERLSVFMQSGTQFPIVPPAGVVAVIVDPMTGAILDYAEGIESVIHAVQHHGAIGYALADIAVPDELGGLDPYWTVERAQRLYDDHRRTYVNCAD